ncbi:MAG: hypothetical protein ISS47_06160 [Candidatus Omnitrophica bacterium]|nr:hypothetical protein [Candidatus Omnitrophota bacterium]
MQRFAMTPFPKISGNLGVDVEKVSQWFLEKSFFLDFVFRNPKGKKKGKELADAVVLYDDVLLMLQVKSQHSKRDPYKWAEKNIKEALRQLNGTRRMLAERHVTRLHNELHGEISIDINKYLSHIGLIIIAQDSPPFIAEELVPDLKKQSFPIHVISLRDFFILASRLDTAGDFICALELRQDIVSKVNYFVHEEEKNITKMLPYIDAVLRKYYLNDLESVITSTCNSFKRLLTGELTNSSNWRYGLLVDDIIARAHDTDPSLVYHNPDTAPQTSIEIATYLGYLTRERRIALGKRMFECVTGASDGDNHHFCHYKPSLRQVFVFLATSKSREERIKLLRYLLYVAQVKFNADKGIGIATEPPGEGRSYDMALHRTLPSVELGEELKLQEGIVGKTGLLL